MFHFISSVLKRLQTPKGNRTFFTHRWAGKASNSVKTQNSLKLEIRILTGQQSINCGWTWCGTVLSKANEMHLVWLTLSCREQTCSAKRNLLWGKIRPLYTGGKTFLFNNLKFRLIFFLYIVYAVRTVLQICFNDITLCCWDWQFLTETYSVFSNDLSITYSDSFLSVYSLAFQCLFHQWRWWRKMLINNTIKGKQTPSALMSRL